MTFLLSIVDLFAVLLFLAAIRAARDHQRRRGLPYPPGPRPLPIIGNLLDIPKKFSWLAYSKFSKKHGNILSFQIFGQVIVVLNSAEAAKDLLEKRSAIYSDRPVLPILEMIEWEWSLLMATSSGSYWRLGRRMLDRGLRPVATASYRPMIQARTHVLLSRLLENSHQWEDHIDLLQGELIFAVTYGYQVCGRNDRLLDAPKRGNKIGSENNVAFMLVNQIPLLRHIPEWLPWFSYKKLIRVGRELGKQVKYPPIQFVKESMLNGTAVPSLALENLQELEDQNLNGSDHNKVEEVIAGTLASMYTAGLDTTVSAIKWFLVAMMLSPDIQKRAQAELDSVTGRERLPTFEDRPRLPFVDAVCREILRWRPVAPVGIPHAVTKDDVYAGFFIPKGAMVIGNIWSILQDPARYPEPDMFKPERFLNADGTLLDDPVLMSVFGFGKRICPGRHFADAILFISIASLFSAFNIERGEKGGDKLSDYTTIGALLSFPNRFPCSFVPRDNNARELILSDIMSS